MIWLVLKVLGVWAAVDVFLAVLYRGTGFKTNVSLNPMGHWNLLGWEWSLVRHTRDDAMDMRLWPNVLRDEGFSVAPLCMRIVVNRVVKVRDGHGPIVANETERERMREKERKRANTQEGK